MNLLTERIDQIFAEWDKPDSPGCILAIIKDGEFAYKRGYGRADLERGVPIGADSLFDIGSTGKQFTAAVIAILASQGILTIDAPISKHLPEMPPYSEKISIRHLLNQTSGLRDYLTLMDLRGMVLENVYSEALLLDLITRQKGLNFTPGSEYLYSNSGYFLLGVIAQRVTGKHITELIRELILFPLGMAHTTFNKDFRPIVRNRALSYDVSKENGGFINALALSGGFGDGALLSCVDDLLLWDNNFYGNKLNNAQPDLLDQLHTTGLLNNGKPITYALGLIVTSYKGQKVVQHGGGWAGYRSEMMRFPDQQLTIICLSNLGSMEPTLLCQQVADVVLEDVLAPEKAFGNDKKSASGASPAINFSDFCGIYQGKLLTFDLFLKDGNFTFSNGKTDYPLTMLDGKKFQVGAYPVFLTFSGRNNERLVMTGERTSRYRRILPQRYTPSLLVPFTGKYYSPELDIHYTITGEDGRLQLKRSSFDEPQPIYPFAPNALRAPIGELRLRLSKEGAVKGFTLNAGRVNNIRFKKVK
jgi:CubicO group peptidase (beta-lactamase class C family)